MVINHWDFWAICLQKTIFLCMLEKKEIVFVTGQPKIEFIDIHLKIFFFAFGRNDKIRIYISLRSNFVGCPLSFWTRPPESKKKQYLLQDNQKQYTSPINYRSTKEDYHSQNLLSTTATFSASMLISPIWRSFDWITTWCKFKISLTCWPEIQNWQ